MVVSFTLGLGFNVVLLRSSPLKSLSERLCVDTRPGTGIGPGESESIADFNLYRSRRPSRPPLSFHLLNLFDLRPSYETLSRLFFFMYWSRRFYPTENPPEGYGKVLIFPYSHYSPGRLRRLCAPIFQTHGSFRVFLRVVLWASWGVTGATPGVLSGTPSLVGSKGSVVVGFSEGSETKGLGLVSTRLRRPRT